MNVVTGKPNERPRGGCPSLPWMRVTLCAVALWVTTTACLEVYCRGRGYRPHVTDSKDLWYFWRQRVYRDDGKVIVFLGTSRIMADISLEAMRDRLPEYRAIQLGLNEAHSCVGLLKDLAEDPAFRGIVVCELDTPLLARSHWSEREEYQTYRPPTFAAHVSAIAEAVIADRFVVPQRAHSIRETVRRFLAPETRPRPDAICTSFRRDRQWHFQEMADIRGMRLSATARYREDYARGNFPPWSSLSTEVHDINAMVRNLRARGGNVVFVRAPSSGDRWDLEEQYHPKASNWDQFAAASIAPCIHFKDYAAMRDCQCPDESHLDARDSPRFTHSLIDELVRRDVVDGKAR
jgi:hypothetical protein